MSVNKYEGEPKDSLPVNKYEVVYGTMFISRRFIWAISENEVLLHCQEKYPNIFPLKEINLICEDVDTTNFKEKL